MIDYVIIAGFSACFGLCFNGILQDSGEVLAWKPNFVYKLLSFGKQNAMTGWEGNGLQYALLKILTLCPKCASGWFCVAVCTYLELGLLHYLLIVPTSIYLTYKLENDIHR